jgi:hypothetical protein
MKNGKGGARKNGSCFGLGFLLQNIYRQIDFKCKKNFHAPYSHNAFLNFAYYCK